MVQNTSQRGNALFIILIAVALLAALSFAVTYSSQTGGAGAVSKEKARLMASEILEYSKIVTNAVTQLRLRGCEDSQLSFANATVGTYTNNAAPSDNTCHVFSPAGGGVSWSVPQKGVMSVSPSPSDSWNIYGGNEVEGVGSTSGAPENADLLLALNGVSLELCQEVNGLLKVTSPTAVPPQDSGIDTTRYVGTYSAADVIGDEAAALNGQKAGCFEDTGASKYVFYKVLVAH